ncbi:hypothetical protein A2U01_0058094, partial [Trifolium medium]|nr:hypothetical protein [Trifolium medium]
METTSKDGDKGKQPTKVTASGARRKNAAENPPKKRSRKHPAHPEAAHPEHHQPDDMEEGDSDDDIVCDMEEKMEREGDAAPVPIRRPTWLNP